MPAERQYRYRLEVFWCGGWRKLWGTEKRLELDQYIASNKDPKVQFRVVDTWEEEVNDRGRRHKPR